MTAIWAYGSRNSFGGISLSSLISGDRGISLVMANALWPSSLPSERLQMYRFLVEIQAKTPPAAVIERIFSREWRL